MAELPIARGVFLCENVIVEEGTRDVSLINCFTRRVVEAFPSPPLQFYVYAVFTNGNGTMPLRLAVTHMKDEKVVLETLGVAEFTGPLQELRACIPVKNLVFAKAGTYEVLFDSNGEYLARARLELEGDEGVP